MVTNSTSQPHYWANLLLAIRNSRRWKQARLAEELGTNQETVSRWERGVVVPSRAKQEVIETLAERCNISSLGAVTHIVRLSPYPMLLCDENDTVIAASLTSGFAEGQSVTEHTPEEQHAYYAEFSRQLTESDFWKDSGHCREYHFRGALGDLKAVLVSIRIQGNVYCVVQAVPPAPR